MSLFNNAIIGASGQQGYQISRSVRLRSSASAYFNRTPASSGNSQKFTWSGWVKRGTLTSGYQVLFMGGNTLSDYTMALYFNPSDQLAIRGYTGAFATTTAVYRDPSAWYHIVAAVDTTQATGTDRLRLYVNGVLAASGSVTQNWNYLVNTAVAHAIGGQSVSWGYNYFDGYMTEINFIDGQQLTPSSFGETDAVTGVWKPKKYAGTYGTNGFYLNFSDNSAATAAAIGKDSSGNGKNWTPNNISVTAGSTYDSMLDVPTPYADGGNGRGNYAVMSPIGYRTSTPTPTITDGNLTVVCPSSSGSSIGTSTFGVSSGKWYWEVTKTGGSYANTGVVLTPFNMNASSALDFGGLSNEYAYVYNGNKFNNNSASAYGASYTSNDVIGVALDLDAGTLAFYKNGVSQGTAFSSLPSGTYLAGGYDSYQGSGFIFNFGQRPFAYTPPTGFKALNTQNLPDSTIKKGNKYFDATLYTGNGSTQNIVNSGAMQPDLVWIKNRSGGALSNVLQDSVRGTYRYLQSNATLAENTNANYDWFSSFNSDGFSVKYTSTSGTTTGEWNQNTYTYVGWQWKESATAGFDIVTQTAPASGNVTINHNLGVTPSFVIIKALSGGVANWPVWIQGIGTDHLNLNTTGARSASGYMISQNSTTFVFNGGLVYPSNPFVAYLFAEVAGFSKFGSYTGNGSADGPFVYCGFRPRYVMRKRTDSATDGSWIIYDTARISYNANNLVLFGEASTAEVTGAPIDVLSNGFKLRDSAAGNTSGATYIYAAFAENPFKNALAR